MYAASVLGFFVSFGFVQELGDGGRERPVPVAAFSGAHGDAVVHGVQFGLFALADARWHRLHPCPPTGGPASTVLAPFQVIGPFRVSLLLAVDDD